MAAKGSYNRLKDEQSQYLRQHMNNPVHWWSYGPDAINEAQKTEKPIFLSVGYSTCHWCHVMAHESFEDSQTAKYLNEHFIPIKVDREEHPDLDQYYQLACQAVTGHGGWPLSAFTTPDLKPFFVGTYFPKTSASPDRPTFMNVLENLKNTYEKNRGEIQKNAEHLEKVISEPPQISQKIEFQGHFPAPEAILRAIENYADKDYGGYGPEPKFPHFAFNEWAIEQILEGLIPQELGKHIVMSVEKMLMGGIYDHARGGIHRYSVDKKWLVPHFEKMLYDQAGLLRLLAKTSLIYPSPIIYDSIIQTLEYLRSEMLSDDGYFFAAQDADSEGMEGLYFSFTQDEFRDALVSFDESLADKMETIEKWFQITEQGNFERGLNVISMNFKNRDEFYTPENWDLIRKTKMALLEARRTRIPPSTDNKGLSGWNFMMISALVDVIQYCKIDSIVNNAKDLLLKSIQKIQETFLKMDDETGITQIINSTTKDYRLPLFENHVHYAEAQLRFYEISGNEIFKQNGLQSIRYIFREFYQNGMFFTRSLKYNDNEYFKNIHAPIFDQSYKSPLATFLLLVRKWAVTGELTEELPLIEKTIDTLTHLCLQNPVGFGESIRALGYPEHAFKKIEVPLEWPASNKLTEFLPFFSARFALVYHKRNDESWQICNIRECELQGKGLEEFRKIFLPTEDNET